MPRIARLPRERDRFGRGERLESDVLALPAGGRRRGASASCDSLTSLLEAVPNFRGDLVVPERPQDGAGADGEGADDPDLEPDADREAVDPPAPAASAGSAYADVLMPRSVGAHRDRLTGNTDRQAEADGVRPGRRAAVPSWDEIVFGTRRKKE